MYVGENFFEARFNFNKIMSLELFNQGIGLQVCINTSNFCHVATFYFVFASFHGYSTMIEYLYTKFK